MKRRKFIGSAAMAAVGAALIPDLAFPAKPILTPLQISMPTPAKGNTVFLFLNGVLQKESVDYSISSDGVVTFLQRPVPVDCVYLIGT